MKNKILIFGASGFIGQTICELAAERGIKVVNIGRSNGKNMDTFVECNYSDYKSVDEAIKSIDMNQISAVIFCQRGRLSKTTQKSNYIVTPLTVELNPYLAIHDYIIDRETKRSTTLNIVTITSNAATRPAYDVDYEYEIIKSAQKMAGLALGFRKTNFPVYSNIISFGEISNNKIERHSEWHEKLFGLIKKASGGKTVVDAHRVGSLALMLCSASQLGLNGEVLHAENGLGKISNESILRQRVNERKYK